MAVWQGSFASPGGGDFANHRVSLEITAAADGGGAAKVLASASVGRDGRFALEIPPLAEIKGPSTLRLFAPSGQRLFQAPISAAALKRPGKFMAYPAETVIGRTARTRPGRRRLTGTVVREDGSALGYAGDVTLWARRADGAEGKPTVVAAAATAANGYFWCAYPAGVFAEAYAVFSKGAAASPPVTIGLNEDGSFPDTVFLPVTVPAAAGQTSEACACGADLPRAPEPEDLVAAPEAFSNDLGGGRCVDFTKPDRTIEEFILLHIVRITDPEITGVRKPDPTRFFKVDAKIAALLAGIIAHDAEIRALARRAQGATMSRDDTPVAATDAVVFAYLRSRLGLAPGKYQSAKGLIGELARSLVEAGLLVPRSLLRHLKRDPRALTLKSILDADAAARVEQMADIAAGSGHGAAGRAEISAANPIDWEGDPTFYQATTVSLGHILRFRQVWRADGYSLGDLVYSLPLAPCEKRRIAIVDWERREKARRAEEENVSESLIADISRNRAIAETIEATLDETMRGFSIAGTEGRGMGAGGAGSYGMFTGVVGAGGGHGIAGSYAQNQGNRELAAQTQQAIRDRTLQSASAVRNRLATTVVEVEQGETVRLETRTVANHNHCHAMTMEYFEVLRHFQVTQALDSVQECLFVPFPISPFDGDKALEWRDLLSRFLRDRRLMGGFAAIERLRTAEQAGPGPASGETVYALEGSMDLEFHLNPPPDTAGLSWKDKAWNDYGLAIGKNSLENTFKELLKDFKDDPSVWESKMAPLIAQRTVDMMNEHVVKMDADTPRGSGVLMEFATLQPREAPVAANSVGAYVSGRPLTVMFTSAATPVDVPLAEFNALRILNDTVLPYGSYIKVKRAAFFGRADSGRVPLVPERAIDDKIARGDDVYLPAAIGTSPEVARQSADQALAEALLRHLNANLEYYHKVLWWRMDPNRRYMLLDGFVAPDSDGRSIASVVDNVILAVIGNSLVMPVSGGLRLGVPMVDADGQPLDLVEAYRPDPAALPMRVSVPTGGVFAEAVMGACNSCETKDDTRFWRWSEEPCPDQAPDIQPLSADTRRADVGDLTTKDMPSPIINIQNVPSLPDPTGLAQALQTIATSDAFRDLTGLSENQRNAMSAMAKSLEAAQAFGSEAAGMWKQLQGGAGAADKYNLIDKAVGDGYLTREQGGDAVRKLFEQPSEAADSGFTVEGAKDLTQAAGASGADVTLRNAKGDEIRANAKTDGSSDIDLEDEAEPPPPAPDILSLVDMTSDKRAFYPSRHSISGIIDVALHVPETVSGVDVSIVPENRALIFDEVRPNVSLYAQRPGPATLTATGQQGGAAVTASTTVSIPQFFVIREDPSFDAWLASAGLDSLKRFMILQMKHYLLKVIMPYANVRFVWQVAGDNEPVPAHVDAPGDLLTTITLRDWDPHRNDADPATRRNAWGRTFGPSDTVFNERIDIFAASIGDNALGRQLIAAFTAPPPSSRLFDLTARVFGRAFGFVAAHEAGHAIIGHRFAAPDTAHAETSLWDDIMVTGYDLSSDPLVRYALLTGIRVDAANVANFPAPGSFDDVGWGGMARFIGEGQRLLRETLPVVPPD